MRGSAGENARSKPKPCKEALAAGNSRNRLLFGALGLIGMCQFGTSIEIGAPMCTSMVQLVASDSRLGGAGTCPNLLGEIEEAATRQKRSSGAAVFVGGALAPSFIRVQRARG